MALELGTRQLEGVGAVEVYSVSQDDPLAAPLIAELALEYSSRYGGTREAMLEDLTTYPAEEFAYPSRCICPVDTHRFTTLHSRPKRWASTRSRNNFGSSKM